MADYLVTDTELTSIADALRSVTDSSDSISFPSGMVTDIGKLKKIFTESGAFKNTWSLFAAELGVRISNLVNDGYSVNLSLDCMYQDPEEYYFYIETIFDFESGVSAFALSSPYKEFDSSNKIIYLIMNSDLSSAKGYIVDVDNGVVVPLIIDNLYVDSFTIKYLKS